MPESPQQPQSGQAEDGDACPLMPIELFDSHRRKRQIVHVRAKAPGANDEQGEQPVQHDGRVAVFMLCLRGRDWGVLHGSFGGVD